MISEKIAGQGTNVDGGGALNDILKGIVGLIPEPPAPYELPVATDETLGGVKVGDNLKIDEEGALSVDSNMLPLGYERINGEVFDDYFSAVQISTERAQVLRNAVAIIDDSGIILPNIGGQPLSALDGITIAVFGHCDYNGGVYSGGEFLRLFEEGGLFYLLYQE